MLCAGRGWWLSGILPRHLFQALVFGLGSVCLSVCVIDVYAFPVVER